MRRTLSGLIGVAGAGAVVYARERKARVNAERLAAATIEVLLNAIDANDAETGAHVRRVAGYALILADAVGFDEARKKSVEHIALFHDIGKLDEALTDIFHERSKLTAAEWRAVKEHPERGVEVLEPLTVFYPDLRAGVIAHHERWDGRGYPAGRKGKRIPLAARIVTIADSFDAITYRRRYDHARSLKEATEAIAAGRGAQFDPDLVDLFLSPIVIAEVRKSMLRAHGKPRAKKRRRHRRIQRASEINFRWRARSRSKPARRRQHRK